MKKTNLSDYDPTTIPDGRNYRFGIVVAEWNSEITNAMAQGAVDTLLKYNVEEEDIVLVHVPGSYELTCGADQMLIHDDTLDAVICIGCIIQGETRHFDFIAQAVADGIMKVGLKYSKPVIFSVLTCNTMEQAEDRAGGKHGNKGVEGAVSALKMLSLEELL